MVGTYHTIRVAETFVVVMPRVWPTQFGRSSRLYVSGPVLCPPGRSVGKVVSRPKFAEQISVEVGEQNVIFTGIIFFQNMESKTE